MSDTWTSGVIHDYCSCDYCKHQRRIDRLVALAAGMVGQPNYAGRSFEEIAADALTTLAAIEREAEK